jgi:hypothetical protein
VLENICQHVLAFRSNFFGCLMHRGRAGRPRSSPVPLRGIFFLFRYAEKFFPLPRSGEGLERGRPARLCVLGNRTSLEGTPRRVGERKVGNRPLGGCVFGERSKTKTVDRQTTLAKPKRPKRRTFWFFRCVLAIQLSACADVTARRSVTHLTFANAFPPHSGGVSWIYVLTYIFLFFYGTALYF